MELDLEALDLAALLREATEANQGYAHEHSAAFVLTEIASEITVQADSGRLTQVIANLLSNAAKFSPEGATIGF